MNRVNFNNSLLEKKMNKNWVCGSFVFARGQNTVSFVKHSGGGHSGIQVLAWYSEEAAALAVVLQ